MTMTYFSALLGAAIVLLAGSQPYKIQTSPATVTVIPAGGWHLNEDYPWQIVGSDSKVRKFSLRWNIATAADLPKGSAAIRGGVCNLNTCVLITRIVEVP